MLTILYEKCTKFVSICWELLSEDSRTIARSHETHDFVTKFETHMYFLNFHINIYAELIFHVQ